MLREALDLDPKVLVLCANNRVEDATVYLFSYLE